MSDMPDESNFASFRALAANEDGALLDVLDHPLPRIHFEYNKFLLDGESRSKLEQLSQWLKENEEIVILIEGHCDERGTEEYNFSLGQKRADEVRKFITMLDISPSRIYTISYGEERPLDSRSMEEAYRQNRRSQFVVYER